MFFLQMGSAYGASVFSLSFSFSIAEISTNVFMSRRDYLFVEKSNGFFRYVP